MNNFVLILFISIFGLNHIGALWFFTPFILVLFTTSIIEEATFNFFGLFLACAFFLPTLKTNQIIKKDFHASFKNEHHIK